MFDDIEFVADKLRTAVYDNAKRVFLEISS